MYLFIKFILISLQNSHNILDNLLSLAYNPYNKEQLEPNKYPKYLSTITNLIVGVVRDRIVSKVHSQRW